MKSLEFGSRVFIRSSDPYTEGTFPFLVPAWFLSSLEDGSVMVCIDHPTGVLPAGRIKRHRREDVLANAEDVLAVDWSEPPERTES